MEKHVHIYTNQAARNLRKTSRRLEFFLFAWYTSETLFELPGGLDAEQDHL